VEYEVWLTNRFYGQIFFSRGRGGAKIYLEFDAKNIEIILER
jgi:hypothetical protein